MGIGIHQPHVNVTNGGDEAFFGTLGTFAILDALGADCPLDVSPSARVNIGTHPDPGCVEDHLKDTVLGMLGKLCLAYPPSRHLLPHQS